MEKFSPLYANETEDAASTTVVPAAENPETDLDRISDDAEERTNEQGYLDIQVFANLGYKPIAGARIVITLTGESGAVLSEQTTDDSGEVGPILLPTPNVDYSLSPNQPQPYGEFNVTVTAPGYQETTVSGVQVLSKEVANQIVWMVPEELSGEEEEEVVTIPAHTLYGEYPPKIPEAEIKPIEDTGEIVLSRVVIPEYIIVHDGVPSNSGAPNYWIRYKDYIKNVASSEIYATWPEATIYANILVIMSFTLNRVYTEWYRNQGYSFTITSSTAYDQKWVKGRNTYENINRLVDSVFANYISRPGVKQPLFTAYCDGNRVQCRGLSQWGSKYLGDKGYSAIQILRYYYGNDVYINGAQQISGVPSSYPGYELRRGSSGDKVRQMQNQLNRIAKNFPAIPTITADGIYGPKTEAAVKAFQKIFKLPVTGIANYATWYEISEIYVGVTRVSEPV